MSRAHNPGPERSILVVTYNRVGVRSYLASKPPPKQPWAGCFCGHFSDQERLLLLDFHNELGAFPRRWIKDWFQFVVPVAFACELTPLFSIRRPK